MSKRTNVSDRGSLAAIHFSGDDPIDAILDHAVGGLKADGYRLGGFLQRETPDGVNCCSITHLEDILDGRQTRITQALGSGSKVCRLDPRALAELSGALHAKLDSRMDLLVLNRFGKGESEGQGFRAVIEAAYLTGIPVITAVRSSYMNAWTAFGGESAEILAPHPDRVLAWCRTEIRARIVRNVA